MRSSRGHWILAIATFALALGWSRPADATCIYTDPPPGGVDLATFVDACPDPDITVDSGLTGGICDRTIVGGDILVATMKTVTITPTAGGDPTVCVVPGAAGDPGLRIWGTASNIAFAPSHGRFRFQGSTSPALEIIGTTGHLFAGNGGSGPNPLWIGFVNGDPAAIVLSGAAQAEFRTAFVDTSLRGVSASNTATAAFHQAAFVDNGAIGIIEDAAAVAFNRFGYEPSVFTINGDGLLVRGSGSLSVDHSVFHRNFTGTPPGGVYRYLIRAEDTATVRVGNLLAHDNGDPATRRSMGVSVVDSARSKVIAATWADNAFEVTLSLLTSTGGLLDSFDSIIYRSGVPFQCNSLMGAAANDVFPAVTLPWCVAPQFSFNPTFTTGGLAPGAVLTNDQLYLVDHAIWPQVQDQGVAPATLYFGTGDWNVFDPVDREEACSVDDLGYHNHCPTCGPTGCP